MSKNHRGFGIRELERNGRGACPICKRTGIKVLYEVKQGDQTIKVCKECNARLKNQAK